VLAQTTAILWVLVIVAGGVVMWSVQQWLAAHHKGGPHPALAWLTPQFGDMELFLMSLALLLLFAMDARLRAAVADLARSGAYFRGVLVLAICAGGLGLSLVNVFLRRKKSVVEKEVMLGFAVLVSGCAALTAGLHMMKNSPGVLCVFPIWNIISGGLLLLQYRLHLLHAQTVIVDEPCTLRSIALAAGVLAAVFVVCRFVFVLHWAITFSVCVAYAMSVHRAVTGVLRGWLGSSCRYPDTRGQA